jgi:cytoskeletal protein CcmA (bactofilin family)
MIWTLTRRLHRQEQGVAMIVAITSLLVVVLVSVAVVSLSTHNANQSSFDRNRLQAVAAAEAGIDDWLASLPNAQGATICTPFAVDLPTNPLSHYAVTMKLYGTWPPSDSSLITACPPDVTPAAGLVQSVGTAVSGTVNQAKRTFETLVQLLPSHGGFDPAIYSRDGFALVNKLTDNGSAGNDADLYTNGDFTIQNNETIYGSVYAQGKIDVQSSTSIKQDLWANGSVTLSNTTSVFGSAKSSTSSVTVNNSAHVYGDVRAGTSISNTGTIDGAQIANSPESAPPKLTFPTYGYNQADWTAAGYTINTFSDCVSAKAFVDNMPAGSQVVRVTATCALVWGNNSTVNVRGNLAIITDGSVSFQNQNNWNGIGGRYNVFFIVPWQTLLDCTGGIHDVSFSNNTNWSSIVVGVYTPCNANIANQNVEFGQIFAGTVNIQNNMTFTFTPIFFPGEQTTGYEASVSYIREIINP